MGKGIFQEDLHRQEIKLRAIAVAMSPADVRAVREVCPGVDIVHDPYHIVVTVYYTTGIRRLQKLADSLLRHEKDLLSCFSHRIPICHSFLQIRILKN